MNKTQIFGMYIRQRVKFPTGEIEVLGTGELHYIFSMQGFDINHCQLILKPIAEMSEEHVDELIGLLDSKITNREFRKWLMVQEIFAFSFVEVNRIMERLKEWGYALNNGWFTNGTAIKESEAKQ